MCESSFAPCAFERQIMCLQARPHEAGLKLSIFVCESGVPDVRTGVVVLCT